MNKKLILILTAGILCSCTSLPENSSTRIYTDIPADTSIHLHSISLEPSHILDGISGELPALVESCLSGAGFKVSDQSGEGILELDIFIHIKDWQYEYSSRESVTLRLRISKEQAVYAYRLYTVDTDKSIDSFSWTFSIINKNIKELFSAINDA